MSMWMTSNWLERNKTLIRCGNYSTKKLIWENRHLSWMMKTWDALRIRTQNILRKCEQSRGNIVSSLTARKTELAMFGELIMADGQGDGLAKAELEQAAADLRGSRTCVCAITLFSWVAHARREKCEITHPAVVPSSRCGKYLQ